MATCVSYSFCADKKYSQSIQVYGEAIELNPNNAVYYSNRALAHIRMENYGAALEDAVKATEIDPAYVKVIFKLLATMWLMGLHQV